MVGLYLPPLSFPKQFIPIPHAAQLMCSVDDGDDDPDFIAHASVPEDEAAGRKRKRSKKNSIPNKRRKFPEENQSRNSKSGRSEPFEESGMLSFLRPGTSLRLLLDVPNPLPKLLKLQGSAFFADEVPRTEKRGSGQLTEVKRRASPVASTFQPVRHKVAVSTLPIDSDATGTPDIHPYCD